MSENKNYYEVLRDEITIQALATGEFRHHKFFEYCAELLEENGDVPHLDANYLDRTDLDPKNKFKINGFYYDDSEDYNFVIAIADYNETEVPQTFTTLELKSKLKYAERFLQLCQNSSYLDAIEPTSPGFPAVYMLSKNFKKIKNLRVMYITNNIFSGKIKELETSEVLGIKVAYQLCDLKRLNDIESSRTGHEPISIKFSEFSSASILALKASLNSDEYESYLLAIPGSVLANIYQEFGARLLEQNVRTFLQARGNVNKGIIDTATKKPEMFFAYNNGLTATASSVECSPTSSGLEVETIENLQIVNGGQTTASLVYAKLKNNCDLEEVFVQMKLSVIKQDRIAAIVPKISEYANTQNKVNAADFFATHPFQVNFKELCDGIPIPLKEGEISQTYWFYERSRGQYRDATAYSSEAERKAFALKYPKSQLITKTELARYYLSFEHSPDIVAKGATAAFLHFASLIGPPEKYQTTRDNYGTAWFKNTIAKVILFKELDKVVAKADWYEGGGTKAAVITYTIAWIVFWAKEVLKSQIELEQVWQTQKITSDLKILFEFVAKKMNSALKDTAPDHVKSVPQWAKRKGCWEQIRKLDLEVPRNLFEKVTIDANLAKQQKRLDRVEARRYNAVRDYVNIVCISQEVWERIDEAIKSNKMKGSPLKYAALRKVTGKRQTPTESDAEKLYELIQDAKLKIDLDEFNLKI